MVYFPTEEEWTLTTRPDRIPVEERFPQHFAVNSLPVTVKRATNKGKKAANAKPKPARNMQDKKQHMINQYFSRSQAKGKEKETVQEDRKLQYTDKFEECFENVENHDVEHLIGRLSF